MVAAWAERSDLLSHRHAAVSRAVANATAASSATAATAAPASATSSATSSPAAPASGVALATVVEYDSVWRRLPPVAKHLRSARGAVGGRGDASVLYDPDIFELLTDRGDETSEEGSADDHGGRGSSGNR